MTIQSLSDSQLNDLLATKVMGWHQRPGDHWWWDKSDNVVATFWDPCISYDDLRQVEEALSVSQKGIYAAVLIDRCEARLECDIVAEIIGMSARQRCEAIAKVVE